MVISSIQFCCLPSSEAATAALKRALGALNTHLASTTYLVGHSITLADIVLTCNLAVGFSRIFTKSFTSDFPHIERYFWTMVNQPNFFKIIGKLEQAESAPPFTSAKKPAQPKETPKEKPEDEPRKEVAKPEVEEALEEEAPKPKAKNPLDVLPPGKMIPDEWKRLYSNTKTNFHEDFGTCMIPRDTPFGFVTTSTMKKILSPCGSSITFCLNSAEVGRWYNILVLKIVLSFSLFCE